MIIAASTVELTLRMLVSLAIVSGLLWVITHYARRRIRGASAAAALDVCTRHQLTKSSAIAVVRAGRRHFLVGVNDNAITLLAEGDDLVVAPRIKVDDEAGLELEPVPAELEATEPKATRSDADRPKPVVDVRKNGARKRRSGGLASASSGIGVIEALRERSVRR
jgi:flagellar biogenesis protein FliO